MSAQTSEPRLDVHDQELLEHVAAWADALRAAAERWRFRARAGRLGPHSLADVLRVVSHVEAAATFLDPGGAPPAEHEPFTRTLQESEERFRLLVDTVGDYAIFMLDPEGRVMTWNAGAERIKGYRAEEILGKHFEQFYPAEDRASRRPHRELELAMMHGSYHEEGWRLRKDARPFWADVTITALRNSDGTLRGFGKVTRDLTAQRQADEALRASEERARLFIENVQDYAIFMLDPDGRVASWNVGAERLKGYQASEIIGKHLSVFYPPEATKSGRPERALAIAAREGRFTEEAYRVRKDGTQFWASVLITAVHDSTGTLKGFGKVTRDFTERKRAEDAIRKANQDLEARVRQRTAELEEANKEIEAFSYSVSHDLRAPLRAINGFSQALAEAYGPRLEETGRHYLERLRSASLRMDAFIEGLLRFSQSSRSELVRRDVDLAALARDVVAEVASASPERAVAIEIAEPMRTRGDPQLLRAVLENLLGNAWKFTSKTPDPRIEVGTGSSEGQTAFYVRDNGAGFDMSYAHRLFTPFQRLHSTSEFSGTGIGLATTQRILHRHGGRIWASGEPGKGATFWFTIGDGP
jgi:PAS domain S-box-containing protein